MAWGVGLKRKMVNSQSEQSRPASPIWFCLLPTRFPLRHTVHMAHNFCALRLSPLLIWGNFRRSTWWDKSPYLQVCYFFFLFGQIYSYLYPQNLLYRSPKTIPTIKGFEHINSKKKRKISCSLQFFFLELLRIFHEISRCYLV